MIHLDPAFQWRCPRCGVTNFDRGVEVSDTEIEPPTVVSCRHCGLRDDAEYEEE